MNRQSGNPMKNSMNLFDQLADLRLVLALLFSLYASVVQLPAYSATATATVTVNVISTIGLNNLSGMVFGDISSSASAGIVLLNTSGSRIATGGVTINSAVPGGAATFDVIGDPNASYAITLPTSVVLTNPSGNSMLVDNFTSTPVFYGLLDAGGRQSLQVGARLNVTNNQVFGAYTGLMSVTVEYN